MTAKKTPSLKVVEGNKADLEVELVKKLKAKTINEEELNQLLGRLKKRRGHLKSVSSEILH